MHPGGDCPQEPEKTDFGHPYGSNTFICQVILNSYYDIDKVSHAVILRITHSPTRKIRCGLLVGNLPRDIACE